MHWAFGDITQILTFMSQISSNNVIICNGINFCNSLSSIFYTFLKKHTVNFLLYEIGGFYTFDGRTITKIILQVFNEQN